MSLLDLGSAESRAMCSGRLVQFRMILKIILKKKEKSSKLQASSLTTAEGYDRIKIERKKYE